MFKNIVLAGMLVMTVGCSSTPEETMPANVGPTVVIVAPGQTLRAAVVQAATRRGWMPEEKDASTIRCVLVQRNHRVAIDVKLLDDTHYAIDMVESNIPVRKLSQWVGMLQRSIAMQASSR